MWGGGGRSKIKVFILSIFVEHPNREVLKKIKKVGL